MRFILVSFVFMAWAFYEMSGGSDFDPDAVRAARMAELEMEEKTPAPAPAPAPVVVAKAPKVVVDTDPPLTDKVTRVSLNLTTLEKVEPVEAPAEAEGTPDITQVAQNVGTVTSSADTPAIIPSLINPNDGISASSEDTAQFVGFEDLRTVSGNRVNVRGGPGTNFGVIGRLVRGDEVKVLEENGAGWVRFETTDGSTAGWMADFLLTDG